jgi:hypothetical protein
MSIAESSWGEGIMRNEREERVRDGLKSTALDSFPGEGAVSRKIFAVAIPPSHQGR